MNPRQAAALMLLGWYLMTPPFETSNDGNPNFRAPLSRWDTQHVYDSARDCDAIQSAWHKRAHESGWEDLKSGKEGKEPGMTLYTFQTLANSLCIATDDPRLKPK